MLATFLLLTTLSLALSARLESYNVDKSQMSVSGLSSGGAMSTQFHVAFSAKLKGCGVIAGVPYYCAQNSYGGTITCAQTPVLTDVQVLIDQALAYAASGEIDDTTNMSDDNIYIFHGTIDNLVRPENGVQIETFYTTFSNNPDERLLTKFDLVAQHSFVTDNPVNTACDLLRPPYINYCQFDTAFPMLNHIYDNLLTQPGPPGTVPIVGDVLLYDQIEFELPGSEELDIEGFIYIPSECRNRTIGCRLHVAFHGCLQGREFVGDDYLRLTGYLEVAELNNIIIIFPQMLRNLGTNVGGCWDYWGFTGSNYATKNGWLMSAINQMIDRVTGDNP